MVVGGVIGLGFDILLRVWILFEMIVIGVFFNIFFNVFFIIIGVYVGFK